MAKTAVLNHAPGQVLADLARRPRQRRLLPFLCCMLALMNPVFGASSLAGLEGLTYAQQYRQLNLALMVAEGVEPEFLNFLLALPASNGEEAVPAGVFPLIDVDAFQTPLNRIVDQTTMVRRAAAVFRYEQQNHAAILNAIEDLAAAYPSEVASIDLVSLAEDAIIVRTALAGNIEYLPGGAVPPVNGYLQHYQSSTIYLRNVMEFWDFNQELADLTDQAMDDAGGRMAAYQRMVEEEPGSDTFTHHLQAVEQIYWQTRNGKGKAPKIPGNEFIESEAQVQ